jgi:hypothetical protein
MSKQLYELLSGTIEERAATEDRAQISEIANLYEGKLPDQYLKYFPQNEPHHVVNMVRLAHDDLATSIGRMPDIVVDALNQSNSELKKVGLLEKIATNYLLSSLPAAREFMWQLAWWTLTGRAVAIVVPGEEGPHFELRDPRSCYPGVKKRAGNAPVELTDLLFKYEIDAREAKNRGLLSANTDATDKVTVIEYIDDNRWVLVAEGGVAQSAEHGLGVVPGHVFQAFSPNQVTGLSQFQDQVSLMVAISRLISQKLAYGDRLVYPVYWVKGHEGAIKVGPFQLNKLNLQGEMGALQPTTTFQADQDIGTLERFSRILNRNPEVRQGEIAAKSTYTSAKTLEQLAEAIDTVIGRYWDIISVGMRNLMEAALRMDEILWPNKEKNVRGIRGDTALTTYVPSKDIAGRYDVRIHYGFGVGGYQGFLQNIQAQQGGVQSKKRVMESMPGVSDVAELEREIELEKMDEAGIAQFQTLAASGELDIILWSELREQMSRKGTPLVEVIRAYEERIREQAQQALAQGGAGTLTTPGPEAAPEEEQGPPGLPPSALLGV